MSFALPQAIARFIGAAPLIRDRIGESPCSVYAFSRGRERFFLKTSPAIYAPTTYSVAREARLLDWLGGRLGVPEVVLVAECEAGEAMITRAVPGEPLSTRIEAGQPVVEVFAEALRQLQGVPVAACPFRADAAFRLEELDYLVSRGLIDSECDLEQWPGLATPQDLLERLRATLPQEELVFAHGDLGDSNLFIDAEERLHFIDFGRGGPADRWMDIAFAQRNLREEVSQEAADELLAALGRPDQPRKRLFFEQLDELF